MPLVSDTSLNLKNINTDLTAIVSRFNLVLTSTVDVVGLLAGPVEPANAPVTPNSATAALLSAIYGNLQQLDYLAAQLTLFNNDLASVVSGEQPASDSSDGSFRTPTITGDDTTMSIKFAASPGY